MTAPAPTPLPPGSTGLPLLGETLAFLRDSFGFVESRVKKHGPVFRTHLLGRPTVVMVGPEACERWIDAAAVERAGAMPPHVKELFGGESLPSLDGATHATRKHLVLAGFGKSALVAYLPVLEDTLKTTLAAWAEQGELPLLEPLKQLAITAIARTVMGMEPGPVLDQLLSDYAAVSLGFGGLPIALPGTAFSRARAAMERVLGVYEEVVVDHQKNPRKDGLTRMLEAKAPDGTTLTVDAAKRELHHIVIAGLIVWAELATVLMALPEQKPVLDALRAEVDALPAGPLTLGAIDAAPLLRRVVMETKRMCPILPAPFGRAKKEFRVGGYTVPEGWMVLWGVHSTNRFAGIYTEPDRFDPSRFVPKSEGGRGEHESHVHAFVPQGPGAPGGHRCPGLDFSTVFMSAFLVHLLRGYTWALPEQAPGLRWNLIPPEPADGLRVKLTRRAPTA